MPGSACISKLATVSESVRETLRNLNSLAASRLTQQWHYSLQAGTGEEP